MKILHVYDGHEKTYGGRGSVPTVVWNIAKISAQDHDVTIIERRWCGLDDTETQVEVNFTRLNLSLGSNEPWSDIPYKMINSKIEALKLLISRLEFSIKAKKEIMELDPDIIHYHLPFSANYLTFFLPQYRDCMVYTAHLGETNKRVTASTISPDVFLAKRTAATTVLNDEMKASFTDQGVDEEKLRVITNGVNISEFTSGETEQNDTPLVLFVGTVTPRKRVLDFVEAAFRVRDIDSQFVIAGKNDIAPEYYEQVKGRVLEYNLEDRFEFTGFVSNDRIQELYSKADVFILPSQEEGFGMVVTEAMATKTPVIGARVGGIPTQIDDGINGYLYQSGDINSLASRLRTLLQNPDLRQKMGEKGRNMAVKKFSWEAIADQFIELYHHIA